MKLQEKDIRSRKKTGPKLVMLTAYDYPTARREDSCGIDVLLVGDSVGTNMLGYESVSQVTVQDMAHHTQAVARGATNAFVLTDMPFGSFDTVDTAVANAKALIAAGASGVKIEGEEAVLEQIKAVTSAGIPVCAHIGFTPQTKTGKAAVQGKDIARAQELLIVAQQVEQAGACMVVLELIPEMLAKLITQTIDIPTIGIGGGRYCDGQVQVILDIAGFSDRVFRHAKQYDTLGERLSNTISTYKEEVRSGIFPTENNASRLPQEVLDEITQWLSNQATV